MFMNTAALESPGECVRYFQFQDDLAILHPIFFKLRMMPDTIPIDMQIIIAAIKQIEEPESCSKFMDLLMIKTDTVKNCCRAWATLIKWRERFPKRRKKGSPKLIIGYLEESRSR